MLVKAVVARKVAVHPSRRLPVRSPNTTINPEAIPIKLINTWSKVKVAVLIPRIMAYPFQVSAHRERVVRWVDPDSLIVKENTSRIAVFSCYPGRRTAKYLFGGKRDH